METVEFFKYFPTAHDIYPSSMTVVRVPVTTRRCHSRRTDRPFPTRSLQPRAPASSALLMPSRTHPLRLQHPANPIFPRARARCDVPYSHLSLTMTFKIETQKTCAIVPLIRGVVLLSAASHVTGAGTAGRAWRASLSSEARTPHGQRVTLEVENK